MSAKLEQDKAEGVKNILKKASWCVFCSNDDHSYHAEKNQCLKANARGKACKCDVVAAAITKELTLPIGLTCDQGVGAGLTTDVLDSPAPAVFDDIDEARKRIDDEQSVLPAIRLRIEAHGNLATAPPFTKETMLKARNIGIGRAEESQRNKGSYSVSLGKYRRETGIEAHAGMLETVGEPGSGVINGSVSVRLELQRDGKFVWSGDSRIVTAQRQSLKIQFPPLSEDMQRELGDRGVWIVSATLEGFAGIGPWFEQTRIPANTKRKLVLNSIYREGGLHLPYVSVSEPRGPAGIIPSTPSIPEGFPPGSVAFLPDPTIVNREVAALEEAAARYIRYNVGYPGSHAAIHRAFLAGAEAARKIQGSMWGSGVEGLISTQDRLNQNFETKASADLETMRMLVERAKAELSAWCRTRRNES